MKKLVNYSRRIDKETISWNNKQS